VFASEYANTLLMMTYAFFTAQIRFIVRKTDQVSPDIQEMMATLENVADQIDEKNDGFTVKAQDLRITARALAGVAGFMQQHILPETVAAGHQDTELQVRWTIDNCMSIMARLMSHAELNKDSSNMDVKLPPPP